MFLRSLEETSRIFSAKLAKLQALHSRQLLLSERVFTPLRSNQSTNSGSSKKSYGLLGSTVTDIIEEGKDRIIATSKRAAPEETPSKRLIGIVRNGPNQPVFISKRLIRTTTQAPLAEKFKMEWPKITLFGDSITRRSMDVDNGCWGSMIANVVGSYFDVDFRGFEGYNTRWALELTPQLFPKSYLDKVELFVLFFGHNDSWESKFPLPVTLDEYEKNMRSIIKYLVEHGLERQKIVLITPTWYHRESFEVWLKKAGFPPISKDLQRAKQYSDVVKKIAKDEQIDVVDFFELSCNHQPLEEMFCDGVHYSRLGAKMLFDLLMPVIQRKLEAQYKKPLTEMWHVMPLEQRPEIKPVLEAMQKQALNSPSKHQE